MDRKGVAAVPEKAGLVTLFVDNLPVQMHNRWLRNIFSWHGKVEDVFISQKKRKGVGTRFGFVRVGSMIIADRMMRRCNGVFLGERCLSVSVAKFGKTDNKFMHKRWVSGNGKNVTERWVSGNGKNVHLGKGIQMNSKIARSYAQVVKEGIGSKVEDKFKDVTIDAVEVDDGWLQRCTIGVAEFMEGIFGLEKVLINDITQILSVKLLGGRYVLLEFSSVECKNNFIALEEGRCESRFERFMDWHPRWKCEERFVWLSIEGVPLNAWNKRNFSAIAELFGKVICMDRCTFEKNWLDCGRVLIATNVQQPISELVVLNFSYDVFPISVKESPPCLCSYVFMSCFSSPSKNDDTLSMEGSKSDGVNAIGSTIPLQSDSNDVEGCEKSMSVHIFEALQEGNQCAFDENKMNDEVEDCDLQINVDAVEEVHVAEHGDMANVVDANGNDLIVVNRMVGEFCDNNSDVSRVQSDGDCRDCSINSQEKIYCNGVLSDFVNGKGNVLEVGVVDVDRNGKSGKDLQDVESDELDDSNLHNSNLNSLVRRKDVSVIEAVLVGKNARFSSKNSLNDMNIYEEVELGMGIGRDEVNNGGSNGNFEVSASIVESVLGREDGSQQIKGGPLVGLEFEVFNPSQRKDSNNISNLEVFNQSEREKGDTNICFESQGTGLNCEDIREEVIIKDSSELATPNSQSRFASQFQRRGRKYRSLEDLIDQRKGGRRSKKKVAKKILRRNKDRKSSRKRFSDSISGAEAIFGAEDVISDSGIENRNRALRKEAEDIWNLGCDLGLIDKQEDKEVFLKRAQAVVDR